MKKVLVMVFVLSLMFTMSAFATDHDQAVSSDEDYVGKDMLLEEGQMGITAIEEDADMEQKMRESSIVESDMTEGEMAEGTIGDMAEGDYVGKDAILKDGEMGITSVGANPATTDQSNNFLLTLIAIGSLLLITTMTFVWKKKQTS